MARGDRVLHLIEHGHPSCGWPLLRALAAAGQPVGILGPAAAADEARRSAPGLRVVCTASAPRGLVRPGALALRAGLGSGTASAMTAVAWSDHAERVAEHRLSGLERVVRGAKHQESPPSPPHAQTSDGHRVTRERLGIEPGETVLVALGGPSGSVDAFAFAYLAGVLALAGVALVTVVPARAGFIDRALRFVERHGHAWRVVFTEFELPELLGIADLAAYLAPARSQEAAVACCPSLRGELAWLLREGVPAVIRAEAPVLAMLENMPEHGSRVLSVPADRPGLETVRAVRTVLASGRTAPARSDGAFAEWTEEIRRLGEEREQPVGTGRG